MNKDNVKPGKYDHLRFVYHFTIHLIFTVQFHKDFPLITNLNIFN